MSKKVFCDECNYYKIGDGNVQECIHPSLVTIKVVRADTPITRGENKRLFPACNLQNKDNQCTLWEKKNSAPRGMGWDGLS